VEDGINKKGDAKIAPPTLFYFFSQRAKFGEVK
jgi:hypothetical protein